MTKCKQSAFGSLLIAIAAIAHLYNWKTDKQGRIVGEAKGKKVKEHSPLTALVNGRRREKHQSPLRYDEHNAAAKQLGLSQQETSTFINAITGDNNRGYAQILRGRIKKAVGLN